MKRPKPPSADPRRNIIMQPTVYAMAQELMRVRHMGRNKFSQLLTDLVLDAHKRQASGEEKSPEKSLAELVELLAKNRALEATLKERMERFKLERKGATEALALCEEDLKKAQASAT